MTDNGIGFAENWRVQVNIVSGLNNMTLVSDYNDTATSEPDIARPSIFIEAVDALTINTDILVYVSRDNKTTWDLASLVEVADLGDSVTQYSDDVTLTSTGTAIEQKLVSANNKDFKLHGWGVGWRDS